MKLEIGEFVSDLYMKYLLNAVKFFVAFAVVDQPAELDLAYYQTHLFKPQWNDQGKGM